MNEPGVEVPQDPPGARTGWWVSGVLRDLRLLFGAPLVVGFLAAVLTFVQPREYASNTTFIPQSSMEASTGAFSGLAAQLGFAAGVRSAGQSPDFYAALARSRLVLGMVASEEFESIQVERFVSPDGTLIGLLTGRPASDPEAFSRGVELLKKRVSTVTDRTTGVVRMEVATPSAPLSEAVAARILKVMERFDLDKRQERARAERTFIAARLDVAEAELARAENELKLFLQQNREFRNAPELMFEHDRLQRHVVTRQQLWAGFAAHLEQARLEEVRNTPLITVIDPPEGSGSPLPRGTIQMGVLLWILASLAAGLVVLFRAWAVYVETRGRQFHGDWAAALSSLPHWVRRLWVRE